MPRYRIRTLMIAVAVLAMIFWGGVQALNLWDCHVRYQKAQSALLSQLRNQLIMRQLDLQSLQKQIESQRRIPRREEESERKEDEKESGILFLGDLPFEGDRF